MKPTRPMASAQPVQGAHGGPDARQTAIPGVDVSFAVEAKPTGVKGSARGLVHRRRKTERDRIAAYLSVELGSKLRRHSTERRTEMSEVVEAALVQYFAGLVLPSELVARVHALATRKGMEPSALAEQILRARLDQLEQSASSAANAQRPVKR